MRKRFQSSLSICCSVFLLVLPGPGERTESTDFDCQKKIVTSSAQSATFTLQPFRQSFLPLTNPPILEDAIDPGAIVEKMTPEPDYFWDKTGKKMGYPSQGQYASVKQVAWVFPEQKKWQQESSAPSYHYRYNCHYRDEFTTFPENKLTDHLTPPLGKPTPLLQVVEGKQWLFVVKQEGTLQALNPRTQTVYWEYHSPLGISVEEGFVTWVREKKTVIMMISSKPELILFNAVDGAILWRQEVKGNPTAPLQLITKEADTYVLAVTDKQWTLVDTARNSVLLQKEVAHTTTLSPLLVQLPDGIGMMLTYPKGLIEMVDQQGKVLWGTQVKGEINYDPSAIVRFGSLHVLVSTTEKLLYWIDGLSGKIRGVEKLPGLPRSPTTLAEEDLVYSLLVSQASEKSENSYFFGGSLEKTSLPRMKIAIPGYSFIGLAGMRTINHECYYVITHDYQWMVINPSVTTLSRAYPIPLLSQSVVKPVRGFLTGRGMILCEGAIVVHLQEQGLLIIGNPYPPGAFQSLQSGPSNQTEAYSNDASFFSGSRTRTDMDYLPPPTLQWQRKWDLAPGAHVTEILSPTAYYLEKQQLWISVMPGKDGKITFLGKSGEILHQYAVTKEPILTAPILTQHQDGTLTMYIVSTQSLQKIVVEETLKKIKVIWKTEDLGSLGGSFNLYESDGKAKLLLVDNRSYLTSVDEASAAILFRVKVDAFSFAITKYLSTSYLFCGSKAINLKNGDVVMESGSAGSDSTVVGMNGTIYLLQSDDLDMICIDFTTRETCWRIRKLWCKAYCFGYRAPAIYRYEDQALSYWADYKRVICMDVNTGMIRWIYHAPEDFFHSTPTVTVVGDKCQVFVGSIRGYLYAMDGWSGDRMLPYPLLLPGKEEPSDSLKGLSSPVLLNGCLLINRVESGVIQLGELKPPNQRYHPIMMRWQKKDATDKKYIFNRAHLLWDGYYRLSQRVKWKITEGNPIIFLTFLKKMKKLM